MSNLSTQAESVIEKWMEAEEDQLYEEIGIRAKAIVENLSVCSSFDPMVTYDQNMMGPMDSIREFGKRLFKRWEVSAYKLICGSKQEDQADRKELLDAFGANETKVAAVMAALLVSNFGLAAPIAAIVATLVIKHFFRPAYEEFCKGWKEKLDQND